MLRVGPGAMVEREDGDEQKVFKYQLKPNPATGRAVVRMPGVPVLLSVASQRGDFVLWAAVQPEGREQDRVFYVVGTGDRIPAAAHTFLGTVPVDKYVFHVFEGFQ